MSGTLVPIKISNFEIQILGIDGYRWVTIYPARGRRERYPGTHQNFENLGTEEYRVPATKKFWVPMGTGYRPGKYSWEPMGTGYRPEKKFGYRWVPGTAKKNFLGTHRYR